ncbi:hypothetical protein F5Y16DRAFT_407492 [Xylariaceae sp. FL0255]|nr:hypothetical protein F5Y16DRAFT_407492 [Xylariaceae sp. FL0255]
MPRSPRPTTPPVAWPKGPDLLKKRRRVSISTVLNLMIMLLYLSLSVISLSLSGRKVPTPAGIIIQQVSYLAPSVFPIVFTSLMSHAFQGIGYFLAERGCRLKDLGIFMRIKNTSDAFVSLKYIRSVTSLITPAIFIWALSPLGGQASLRILNTRNDTFDTITTARYTDTGPLKHSWMFKWFSYVDRPGEGSPWHTNNRSDQWMCHAAYQQLEFLEGPMDLWGNVKIPRIELLNDNGSDGWIDTTEVRGVDSFSSLVGIPIHNLSGTGRHSLFIETSYLVLNCSRLEKSSAFPRSIPDRKNIEMALDCPGCPDWGMQSVEKSCSASPLPLSCQRLASFLGLKGQFEPANPVDINIHIFPGTIRLFTDLPSNHSWSARCSATETRVEAHIACIGHRCHTKAVRSSRNDKRSGNLTAFDHWAGHALLDNILWSCQGIFLKYLTTTDPHGWSAAVPRPFSNLVGKDTADNQLSLRLASLLDGYIRSQMEPPGPAVSFYPTGWGQSYTPITGLRLVTQSNDVAKVTDDIDKFYRTGNLDIRDAEANVTTNHDTEVYDPVILWAVILLMCSLTGLAVGVLGIFCDFMSRAHRVFDLVYSFTYNSENFNLKHGGTTLDIEARAEIFGDLRVRLGDLRPYSDVGYIGFALEEKVAALEHGRLYE